jgi:HEAT repeat protein
VPRSVFFLALALTLTPGSLGPGLARAEDDPKFRNRHLSEWLQMLREDPAVDHRRAALLATELIGPGKSPAVVPAIIAALRDDSDEKVREAAATALGRIGERQAAKPLAEKQPFTAGRDALAGALRTDKSGRVRASAATALGRLDKSDAAGAVVDLAATVGSPTTLAVARTAAADTLRRIGAEAAEAVPALRKALEDQSADEPTRTAAALALGNVGDPGLAALPGLMAVLGDARAPAGLVKAVADTLGRLGTDAAAASSVRLGELLTAKGSEVELRRAAAGALDQFGAEGRPALAALRSALQDDDRFVRSLALHAIGQQGPALGSEGRATVTAVLGCFGDRVVEVRVAAAETVAALGAEALGPDLVVARERLREATRDGQKAVREAAAEALKKLQPAP